MNEKLKNVDQFRVIALSWQKLERSVFKKLASMQRKLLKWLDA